MKTNEMSLQEMQQTNGGAGMPPMPENSGSGEMTIRQADPGNPVGTPQTAGTLFDGQSPLDPMFGPDMSF